MIESSEGGWEREWGEMYRVGVRNSDPPPPLRHWILVYKGARSKGCDPYYKRAESVT